MIICLSECYSTKACCVGLSAETYYVRLSICVCLFVHFLIPYTHLRTYVCVCVLCLQFAFLSISDTCDAREREREA